MSRPMTTAPAPVSTELSGTLGERLIRPNRGFSALDLGDLWRYRELAWFLAWRDISVRYKQTVLGVAWAVLQPLLTMLAFTAIFGRLARIPSDGLPYPLFAFCGLLPWQLFAYALTESSNSLIANERLITKVYFPRLIVPLATTLAGLADFAIAFVLLIGLIVFYGIAPTWAVLAVPLLVLFAVCAALAAGLWLSALNVQYRDVRYVLPFLTQIGLFLTPVAYPGSVVPGPWRMVYALNPMVGVVEGFRWALLGSHEPPWATMALSAGMVALLLIGGLYYFRRVERTLADTI